MSLENEAYALMNQLKYGRMSSTAYDTSWFVRLQKDGVVQYPETLNWLLSHQQADGSWGGVFETFHDRLISTLACVNALSMTDRDLYDDTIQRGLSYIRNNAANLQADEYETIGFELLFPMLLDEADALSLHLPKDAFEHIYKIRDQKMKLLPPDWVYKPRNPMAHNLEYLAHDVDIRQAEHLIDEFGSVANSPSAAAYLSMFKEDVQIQQYLNLVMQASPDGGICNVLPFEVFEISWVSYNFLLAGISLDTTNPSISYLQNVWTKEGIGISTYGLMPDADDSALAMNVLRKVGVQVSHGFLEKYRTERGYLCFPFERNPSVSTNIHILDALGDDDSDDAMEIKQHILRFLRETRIDGQYWKDKWHVSPYYTTCHAVIALQNIDTTLAEAALHFIKDTQRPDGSWGIFGGTVEETAYCVQALLVCAAHGQGEVDMARAIAYLHANRGQSHYPELWVGKGLYAPIHVIESSAISALMLYAKARGATA